MQGNYSMDSPYRTVGFELEMSDIKTIDAAEIVYEDLTLWQDRWGTYSKPHLNYDRWHVQSDGSIRNSNKTRCMTTYLDETGAKCIANPSKISKHRALWQGAELISPVFTLGPEIEKIREEFETYVDKFIRKGAVFEKHLFNSLHIHVGIPNVSEEDAMFWMQDIYNVQDTLDSLGNDWKKRNKLTPPELAKFMDAAENKDQGKFTELLQQTKDGKEKFWDHDEVRRIVDIAHKFRIDRPNTIEFRCFSPVPIWPYIEECLLLSIWLIQNWTFKIPYMDYYEELRSRAQKIKEIDEQYYAIRDIGRGTSANLER